MGENKSVPFGLKLAQNIINTFTQSKARHIKETRESVVAWMEEELDFLPAFFANVAAFKADVAAARAALTEEQLAANLNTTILCAFFDFFFFFSFPPAVVEACRGFWAAD